MLRPAHAAAGNHRDGHGVADRRASSQRRSLLGAVAVHQHQRESRPRCCGARLHQRPGYRIEAGVDAPAADKNIPADARGKVVVSLCRRPHVNGDDNALAPKTRRRLGDMKHPGT